jgi:hypothetical protein
LEALLRGLGYEILESHTTASRYFGLTVAARLRRRLAPAEKLAIDPRDELKNLVEKARVLYARSIETLKAEEDRSRAVATHVERIVQRQRPKKSKVYVWGANEYAVLVNKSFTNLADTPVALVDSARSKIGSVYESFPEPIQRPDFPQRDDYHRLFVLCSPSWNSQISDQIRAMNLADIEIVDAIAFAPAAVN